MMASTLTDESGLRIKYETGMYKVGWENSIKEMREFVAEREMRHEMRGCLVPVCAKENLNFKFLNIRHVLTDYSFEKMTYEPRLIFEWIYCRSVHLKDRVTEICLYRIPLKYFMML